MCLGVPMQILEINDDMVLAEIDGVQREASLMMLGDPVAVGDYVIVHAGFAISRIDPAEAEETLRIMREIFNPEDMA
ncbi:HypC/HybG/HupF family hydrogenase formation chaperone [Trichlorobacter lovleyi]|jgi:hydrogenase assembly chaperone HypC/HupF|uniref:Hydrogenase assembly chaperone hypC/hupF n=1 Tax=Trichlorobacter lovleyi (strain ATCC BAA-1151 / DSM 17278 / SZ) TaxID=398767 RepID=B3E957_TRIL1|nr:HypC/HybG/HupF family hydrogenase formation chaperone [Trichlorobacter lovleyi]ACD96770.1 hydrogenase assembly chaperone hypC/hupF [Trichlorobacter lovleyi SZ]QOX80047.1 HypC/HybG/HupF family hydrogenase formation chaperone [Trichlorobacter lovleyi]